MISRAILPILLLIILPDLYTAWRRRKHPTAGRRWLHLFPSAVMLAYTAVLALQRNFAPAETWVLNTYLFLFGLVVVPRFLYMLCSAAGQGICRLCRSNKNYGNLAGLFLVLACWYILIYGSTAGFRQFTVRHVDYCSQYLPPAFDGYRIVLFCDAHVGTYGLPRQDILRAAVDSMNAQKADAIVFAGDLQNMHPQELYPHMELLGSLRAEDGVYSVLGNHDYAAYLDADEVTKAANCRETVSLQRQMGWVLLNNEHRSVVRGNDSIIIAGMENSGLSKRAPKRGNVQKALEGIDSTHFVIMLEHDPTAWRRQILPDGRSRLTLSGHTHAGQFELFGWSPAALMYKEWGGMYTEGGRSLYVSTGLGGFIPFRFGVPGEIVVITLHKK